MFRSVARLVQACSTFFAQERNSRVLCYANANLTRDTQAGELRKFVQFWHDVAGKNPQWLYFDSKLVPYSELSWLNEQKISFVTIRRRGSAVLRRLASLPDSQWQSAVIDIPKRRHQHIEYVDERMELKDYVGEARQVAVRGLGREAPTLFLSNHLEISPRDMVTNYARRNGVEDALGSSVDFFHLDCLSSEVRLNVDLDTVLTVLAHGCYRWLATQLHGFGQAKPKSVYRKFVETSGVVEIEKGRRIVVSFRPPESQSNTARSEPRQGLAADPLALEPASGIRLYLIPQNAKKCHRIPHRGNRR